MKIYYIYRYNFYAAHLAAYLHLGIKNIPWNKNTSIAEMQFEFYGLSPENQEIYVANYGGNKQIFINLLKGIGAIYNIDIKIVDLSKLDQVAYRYFKDRTRRYIEMRLEALQHENNI